MRYVFATTCAAKSHKNNNNSSDSKGPSAADATTYPAERQQRFDDVTTLLSFLFPFSNSNLKHARGFMASVRAKSAKLTKQIVCFDQHSTGKCLAWEANEKIIPHVEFKVDKPLSTRLGQTRIVWLYNRTNTYETMLGLHKREKIITRMHYKRYKCVCNKCVRPIHPIYRYVVLFFVSKIKRDTFRKHWSHWNCRDSNSRKYSKNWPSVVNWSIDRSKYCLNSKETYFE